MMVMSTHGTVTDLILIPKNDQHHVSSNNTKIQHEKKKTPSSCFCKMMNLCKQ